MIRSRSHHALGSHLSVVGKADGGHRWHFSESDGFFVFFQVLLNFVQEAGFERVEF